MKSSEHETTVHEIVIEQKEGDRPSVPSQPPRKKRRWLWLLLGFLLLAGGGILAWRLLGPKPQPPAQSQQNQPSPVKVSRVQTGLVEQSSEYNASLQSRRSVNIKPRVQGQVTQILVQSGAQVATGQAIVQIDSREQQAALSSLDAAAEAAKAQLANAGATLKSLQAQRQSQLADVQLNQREYQRYSSLANQGAVARQTRDQYTNRLATAQAQLNAIDAQIQAQQASISQAEKVLQQAQANKTEQQVQLQYYTIEAPFAGTVGDIPVKVGDFVNTSTQITTVTQNKPLEVEIAIPLEEASKLRIGMPVEIIDSQGKQVGTSQVFFIAPTARDNTQTIPIKALFENSQGQLRADQYARARVIWQRGPGVLIPTTAVSRIAGETFVFVAISESNSGETQYIARQKRVKLGEIQGNNYQVLDGLEPGERIIVSGILNLRDGAPITPQPNSQQAGVAEKAVD